MMGDGLYTSSGLFVLFNERLMASVREYAVTREVAGEKPTLMSMLLFCLAGPHRTQFKGPANHDPGNLKRLEIILHVNYHVLLSLIITCLLSGTKAAAQPARRGSRARFIRSSLALLLVSTL